MWRWPHYTPWPSLVGKPCSRWPGIWFSVGGRTQSAVQLESRLLTHEPRAAGVNRPVEAIARDGKVDQIFPFGADQPSAFRLPWPRFSVIFPSCKANARVYNIKMGHGPHSPTQAQRLHLSAWQKSHTSILRLSQSGLRTQTANQPKFISSIINSCHLGTSL
jgi:hypothetical protein